MSESQSGRRDPIVPSRAERRLWDLLGERHEPDYETELFVADTRAAVATALGVTVDDLTAPGDLRGVPLGPFPRWRGPVTVYLRLPDNDFAQIFRERRLEIRRAWPGTANLEWCCVRDNQQIIRSHVSGERQVWYFSDLTRAAIVQAARGDSPHVIERAELGRGRVVRDAYGRWRYDHNNILLNGWKGYLQRLADRLAPERDS